MKRNKITIATLSIVCLICFVLAIAFLPIGNSYAQAMGIEDKNYCVGNYLNLENAQISHGGETLSPTGKKVTAPNGKVYTDDNILLDDYGYWTVELSATKGGETVVATKEIKVIKSIISSTGNKATASYGYNEKVGLDGLSLSVPIGETVELKF